MKKFNRNDLCHCGSGKKYKNCHQGLDGVSKTQNNRLIIGSAIAIIIVVLSIVIYMNQQPTVNKAPAEAPPGKVWSSEHGHWHDAE